MQLLYDRVNLLLKRYGGLLREREGLRKELEGLRAEHEELKAQLRKTEENLLAMQISQSMPDEQVRASGRKQLDAVIGEIDKILTTLND